MIRLFLIIALSIVLGYSIAKIESSIKFKNRLLQVENAIDKAGLWPAVEAK